jgi:CheY-like chemotaxis protein
MLAYAGRGNISRESLALGDLVSEMVHLLRLSISRNVLLNLNLDKHLPRVEGDATQLRQVLMNLVINASEAIGERSGVISITTGAVQGTEAYLSQFAGHEDLPEGLYVSLEVSDTGCGMAPEVVARLFEPFFTTKFQGRGLGMSAVLGIMKSHHGALKVYTEPEKGTTFRLIFPALEGAGAPAAPVPADEAQAALRKGRILLVDDDETVRAVGAAMLKRLGYEVLLANDGEQGLQAYRARATEIDLVIMDLTMPVMDGEATFRALRAEFPAVAVVITSGYSEHDVSARFAGKGVAGFLQKPFSMDLLRKVLGPLTPG